MNCAIMSNNLDVVKYLYNTDDAPCPNFIMIGAIHQGHIDIVRYLHNVNFNYSKREKTE